MLPALSPWEIFFDTWNAQTAHLPRVHLSPGAPGLASPAAAARQAAHARTWDYLDRVLGWPRAASVRMLGALSLDLVLWMRLDGADRDRLRSRLRSTDERLRAAASLGRAGEGTPVRLPDRYYLPRKTPDGEVWDQMPWPGAVTYVTDGLRYGVEYDDGRIDWLSDPVTARVELFREEFAGAPVDEILQGLAEYTERHPILKPLWSHDLAALHQLVKISAGASESSSRSA